MKILTADGVLLMGSNNIDNVYVRSWNDEDHTIMAVLKDGKEISLSSLMDLESANNDFNRFREALLQDKPYFDFTS
jgi:hypothetical protein